MINRRCNKNGRYVATLVFLLVHLCLLFQDITLNRVICCKQDGTVDLELADFDFRCICPAGQEECRHPHIDVNPGVHFYSIVSACNDCLDVPVGSTFLNRVLSSYAVNSTDSRTAAAVSSPQFKDRGIIKTILHLLPYIRNLPGSFPPDHNPILLC